MTENSQQTRIEGNFLNLIKGIDKNPTANTILIGKKTECFSPKIRNKARMSTLTKGCISWCNLGKKEQGAGQSIQTE